MSDGELLVKHHRVLSDGELLVKHHRVLSDGELLVKHHRVLSDSKLLVDHHWVLSDGELFVSQTIWRSCLGATGFSNTVKGCPTELHNRYGTQQHHNTGVEGKCHYYDFLAPLASASD